MLLNNANQPLSWAVPYLLYAAIQFVWIAAIWFPTHFERFRYVPPGKFSYCYFSASVIWMGALFCTFFKRIRMADAIVAVPHPLISILPINLKNRNWRNYP